MHKQIGFYIGFSFLCAVCVCIHPLLLSCSPPKMLFAKVSQIQIMFSLLLLKSGTLTLHGLHITQLFRFEKLLASQFSQVCEDESKRISWLKWSYSLKAGPVRFQTGNMGELGVRRFLNPYQVPPWPVDPIP